MERSWLAENGQVKLESEGDIMKKMKAHRGESGKARGRSEGTSHQGGCHGRRVLEESIVGKFLRA